MKARKTTTPKTANLYNRNGELMSENVSREEALNRSNFARRSVKWGIEIINPHHG